ncbi:MAG: hypothetical protein J0H78_20805 [Rhizobiales bacterium]|nr:hypothetical protein [Hyphomicrobiales bacterium]OJY46743.1 MAG: hypothetical protein BGP08_17235 [Rhizobiales bacterium 64-17]
MKRSVALALAAPRASWMTRSWMTRSLIGGAAWGAALTAGLTGLDFAQCGAACIDTTAMTAALSIATGIVAMGVLTALARNGR